MVISHSYVAVYQRVNPMIEETHGEAPAPRRQTLKKTQSVLQSDLQGAENGAESRVASRPVSVVDECNHFYSQP